MTVVKSGTAKWCLIESSAGHHLAEVVVNDGTASVMIQVGDDVYWGKWPSIRHNMRELSLSEMLATVDVESIITSLVGDNPQLEGDYSSSATRSRMLDYVCRLRREEYLTKDEAREMWEDVSAAYLQSESYAMDCAFGVLQCDGSEDAYELVGYTPSPATRMLREEILPAMQEWLRNELQATSADENGGE